jgi:hypothetical protein
MLAFDPTGVASIVGELFNSEQSPRVGGPSVFGAADENVTRPHAQERSRTERLFILKVLARTEAEKPPLYAKMDGR